MCVLAEGELEIKVGSRKLLKVILSKRASIQVVGYDQDGASSEKVILFVSIFGWIKHAR